MTPKQLSTEEELYPSSFIQPWTTVKSKIEALLDIKQSRNSHGSIAGESNDMLHLSALDDTEEMHDDKEMSMAVSHGFRLVRTLRGSKSAVTKCLYGSFYNTDVFYTLDSQCVSVWRANRRVKTFPIHIGEKKDGQKESSVAGLARWVHVKEWKAVIVGNMQMQLKILDTNLVETSAVLALKPVLSLKFIDETEQLIVGSMGCVRVRRISLLSLHSRLGFCLI